MRKLLPFLFLLLSTTLLAQTGSRYRIQVAARPLTEALQQVEQLTPFSFYYAPAWLDTLRTTPKSVEGSITEIMNQLLAGTRLEYVILDRKIILTYNTPIITSLPTDSSRQSPEEVRYLFAREYEQTDRGVDEATKTHVIGSRSKLVPGSRPLLAGTITARETGLPLAGAHVQLLSTQALVTTDHRGFFSLPVPTGAQELRVYFVGMKQSRRRLVIFSDGSLNIAMDPDEVVLQTVTVQANADANVRTLEMGVNRIGLTDMKNIPKVLGENDVVKVALTLPGVQQVGEGAAGLNVRGGKPDQNLLLLNGATIYNPYHFFGFFSSFNTDLLESFELYKSSIPVQFGGRLASVFDVNMKAGNKQKISGQGGISPVTSQLSLEVPLVKDKTSLLVGGRSTYSDWIIRRIDNETIRNSQPRFWDIAGGIDHRYKGVNSIRLNAYYSYDRFRLSTDSLYAYDNFNASLKWTHHLSEKLSSLLHLTTSRYRFSIEYAATPEAAFDYGFCIQESWGQLALSWTPSEKHSLLLGLEGRRYQTDPVSMQPATDASLVLGHRQQEEQGIEGALFLSDTYEINSRWSVYAGLRYSGFVPLGAATRYLYQPGASKNANTLLDSVQIGAGRAIARFHGLEPRASVRYALDASTALKAGYNRTRQYIHTLTNTISIAPTDTWKLADPDFLPQIADQLSLGLFKNFKSNTYETSLEFYYKQLYNLLDYKTGANLVLNPHLEADVVSGNGMAYGVELLLKKNTGALNGWISYAYSRSLQRFASPHREERINNGAYFPSNFDKPHSLYLVSNYKLTKRYSFSFNLNYASGRPVTYPTALYQMGGIEIVHYADRNRYRIPDYFRMDIGVNIEGNHRIKKLAHGFWTLSVYNVLGRDNVYSVYFKNEGGRIQGYKLSILAIPIPSVSYNFKF